MSKPIAPAKGIAFAFPDVCLTPAPPSPSPIPIPYPNIAQLADASPVSDESGKALLVGGDHVLLKDSTVSKSSGDEAGSSGGVTSGVTKGECKLVQGSATVLYGPNKAGLVRSLDQTTQNSGNAQGFVMSAFPTVLVGD
jgi:hypothetical protein